MAVQEISKFAFKDLISLSIVDFEKACVVHKPEQIDAYSIYYIRKGKGTYSIDFETYSFDGSALFFMSPGQVFSVDSESINEAYKIQFVRDFYCIQTHDKEVSCNGVLFNNIYESPFVYPNEDEAQTLNFIISSLKYELQTSDTAQYDMLLSYLKQLIIHSVRIKNFHQPAVDESDSKLFKDFSLLVDQNFKKLHSVTEYANRLGLSPKSLTKHFQKAGLNAPSTIIKERLILEAKRQLLYSNESVKQIAYDLGFNDAAYFTRFFKKATNQSPLQFKTTIIKSLSN